MAISKKGLRKITVQEKVYYWKFYGKVFVFNESDSNNLLIIDFGWYDVWDYVNDKDNRPPEFEPRIVTPSFVVQSITYAISKGWNKNKFEIKFKNGNYKQVIIN